MSTKRKKSRVRRIEEAGVRVRIFPRGEWYWLDVRMGDYRQRVSAKTIDAAEAERSAIALAKSIATQQLLGVTPDTITLGQLFASYQEHKGRDLSGQWRRGAEARARLFIMAWGADKPVVSISETDVKAYCAKRRAGTVAPLSERDAADGPRMTNGRRVRPVRDGALDADFRWLSSVFNWAVGHKTPDGKRLIQHNPLRDCKRALPHEKNVRRPIASEARYAATLPHADAVDPAGRLRCALAFARYTGRRESAILQLRASDVLLSRDRVRAALAAAGMDEGLAAHMPQGAVRWSAESDKQGILHVTPISAPMREELDRYLATNPRLGDVPLFPAPSDATKPLRRDVAARLLLKAEARAELPKLVGGVWHPYRRLWATERKHHADVDVAAAGGWKDTKALRLSYQQADAVSVLRAIQNVERAG